MKSPGSLSVFVVDDDKLFTTSLALQLEKLFPSGAKVQTFSTGEECLKFIGTKPQIIILDYYLNSTSPKAMNGLRVLDRVLKENPETKVVMLSAQDKIEIAVDTIRHGAYDYIIKNDRALLRTRLVLTNAAQAIAGHKEMKRYRLWLKIAAGCILLLLATCLVLQQNYPHLFNLP